MDVQMESADGALVVTPKFSRLDALAAPGFRDAVAGRLGEARRLVVSLQHVKFVDSSGLAALISLLKRLPPGGELRLADVNEATRSLLKLTRLDRILPVFGSTTDALGGTAPAK